MIPLVSIAISRTLLSNLTVDEPRPPSTPGRCSDPQPRPARTVAGGLANSVVEYCGYGAAQPNVIRRGEPGHHLSD
jgi:hypothetical protein